MGKLNTSPNIADADGVYQSLIDAHQGLSDAESMSLNARLILLLINHIGDRTVVEEAIAITRKNR
jgi:hypothetical protein